MTCEHCLRGDPENIDIDVKHINTLFKEVDYISIITFTGGEPSLASHIIEKTVQLAEKNQVDIGNFYMATNGKKVSDTFLLALIKLYCFCNDNEISQVVISNDEYHESDNEWDKLRALKFADMKYSDNLGISVIAEGRAEHWGDRGNNTEHFEVEEEDIREGDIYLNCMGEIIAGCDWSYANQPEHKICSVTDDILKAIETWQGKT